MCGRQSLLITNVPNFKTAAFAKSKYPFIIQYMYALYNYMYSQILIKSSLPYFAKVRTLSGRGLYWYTEAVS